jgi:magnesium transporter
MSVGTATQIDLDDPILKHIRPSFAKLHPEQTVREALDYVRCNPPEGRIVYFYVVDGNDRLHGVVPTRRLLLSAENLKVSEIMIQTVLAIPALATVMDACEFFLLHKLLAFPVVDAERRILGIVDIELYTEELADLERREESDDLFQLIGVHLSETHRFSSWMSFIGRFPWLLANIGGGILAAFLTGIFEAELQKVVALALFIPVVLALAESVAIQSVSLALQSLHGKRPTLKELLSKLRVEATTGVMLGLACAFSVALVATLWLWNPQVSLCLIGGITGGVTCAAVIGVAVPNLLRLLSRDPKVAAGPVALALTDMVTLLIYFLLARVILAA